jgi:hypothetical protein
VLKILAISAVLGSLGGVGGGALATVLQSQPGGSKPMVLVEPGEPGAVSSFSFSASDLAAGDWIQRPVDLVNKSKRPLSAFALTITASPSSALDTDVVNGLQLQIDRCRKAWRFDGQTRHYACTSPVIPVVSTRPVIGTDIVLGNVDDIRRKKGKAHLLVTLTLPPTAPNELQGQSSTLTYTFGAA